MKYCFSCMRVIQEDESRCSKCGYDFTDLVSPLVLKPGSCLNNRQYLIGKAIGQGGFGITYIGRDMLLNRLIAIKEFFPSSCAVRDNHVSNRVEALNTENNLFDLFRNKYIEEARILARFGNEPAVVNVFNILQENNTAYIIMNYLNGINLREYVQKNGPFDAKELCRKMLPIIETPGKIHKEGIIHRDISPDNIMIQQDGTLVLLDFGAARYYTEKTR